MLLSEIYMILCVNKSESKFFTYQFNSMFTVKIYFFVYFLPAYVQFTTDMSTRFYNNAYLVLKGLEQELKLRLDAVLRLSK